MSARVPSDAHIMNFYHRNFTHHNTKNARFQTQHTRIMCMSWSSHYAHTCAFFDRWATFHGRFWLGFHLRHAVQARRHHWLRPCAGRQIPLHGQRKVSCVLRAGGVDDGFVYVLKKKSACFRLPARVHVVHSCLLNFFLPLCVYVQTARPTELHSHQTCLPDRRR